MRDVVFLLGTSRSDGNTRKLLDVINEDQQAPILDLNAYNLSPYDYHHGNKDDDFVVLVEKLLTFEKIVFATPVYWYAMSAQLKVFFDRLSDLLGIRKALGKALKGRKTFLVTTGTEPSIPEGFEIPFRRTSEYLDMHYQSALYGHITEDLSLSQDLIRNAQEFRSRLFSHSD